MKIIDTDLKDCYIIEPSVFGDNRGYFSPFFLQEDFDKLGFKKVVQVNRSKSSKGVLRGLHFQKPPMTQAKIVEVIKGAAIDVVVDVRSSSPTYGKSICVYLSPYDKEKENSGRQLFVPRGFAHGFISLEEETIFQYIVDNDYAPDKEIGIIWNDKDLGIDWNNIFKTYEINKPILAERDLKYLTLKEGPKYF